MQMPPGVSDKFMHGDYRRAFDLRYSEQSPACTLDLWLPARSEQPLPVILFFHGGGFRFGAKREDQTDPVLLALDRGYAVADCGYRTDLEAIFPAMLYDARNAVRYIRSVADAYGLDPDRVIAWGPSSGGWLVSMLALTEGNEKFAEDAPEHAGYSCRVNAVIDWCGPCGDFSRMDSDFAEIGGINGERHSGADSMESLFLGCPVEDNPGLCAFSAPCSYARHDAPPFLIVHGREDSTVPYLQSVRLAESLRSAGAKAELFLLPGIPHHGPVWNDCEQIRRITFDYLDSIFYPERQNMNSYLYVGNWGFHPASKGISVFRYDEETADLSLIETVMPEIAAGQLCLDAENRVLYSVNECGDRKNEYGGGGEILAFRIGSDGKLTLLNRRDSLAPEPSYLCLSGDGKYIMTAHHCDPWHVTKIVRQPDGTLTNKVLFDDGSIVLYRLNADGSVGDAVDALIFEGSSRTSETSQVNVDPVTGHIQLVEMITRLHSVCASPDGKMFVTCDKGMDRIYSFRLNAADGKLELTGSYPCTWRSFPRYGAFHPTLPLFYSNCEFSTEVDVWFYDSEKAVLTPAAKTSSVFRDYGLVDGKPVGAQDILVHPDGKSLYVTNVGVNTISVFALDSAGMPMLRAEIPCRGDLPRGIAISPDGRFLLSGNMVSGDITVFRILPDGMPEDTGKLFKAVSPSAMRFFRT